jgi:hypothetical protein
MTGTQMAFGLVVIGMGYVANPRFQGLMLTIVAMLLIIGSLTMMPRA